MVARYRGGPAGLWRVGGPGGRTRSLSSWMWMGLGEAELPRFRQWVALMQAMAIWAQATASHSALWWWRRSTPGRRRRRPGFFPAGDQVPGHGDAVDVFEVGVLMDIRVPVGGQGGLDHRHVEPGVMGNEGLSGQHGVELPPDGEKVRGQLGVLGIDPVDVDVALVVLVAWGLDEAVGGGGHLQPHHESQAHSAGAVGVAGGGFKVNGDKIHMLIVGKRGIAAKLHGKSPVRFSEMDRAKGRDLFIIVSYLRLSSWRGEGFFQGNAERRQGRGSTFVSIGQRCIDGTAQIWYNDKNPNFPHDREIRRGGNENGEQDAAAFQPVYGGGFVSDGGCLSAPAGPGGGAGFPGGGRRSGWTGETATNTGAVNTNPV